VLLWRLGHPLHLWLPSLPARQSDRERPSGRVHQSRRELLWHPVRRSRRELLLRLATRWLRVSRSSRADRRDRRAQSLPSPPWHPARRQDLAGLQVRRARRPPVAP